MIDIKNEINNKINNKTKLVSFDIFDTLLLRLCRTPIDIFGMVYRKRTDLFPEGFTEEDWISLRVYCEKKARKIHSNLNNNYEITLDDIYNSIPYFFDKKEEIKALECETEIENCFLNREIYDLLVELYDDGKIVVLTSDMYLPENIIKNMLIKSGVDQKYISNIYISCEKGCSKRFKELYIKILSDYLIEPADMIHIGDNCESDVAAASQLGISTVHYGLISEANFRFPYLLLEKEAYNFVDGDSYASRIIVASDKCDFWYQTGAMIMGPFMTYFSLWLVKVAHESSINTIRPMMREGEFLTKIIKKASDYMKYGLDVEPLYVSRFVLYKALFGEITKKEIEYLFSTNGLILGEVLDIFKVKDLASEFGNYFTTDVVNLHQIWYKNECLYDYLLEWLCTDEIIKTIRERNVTSADNIIQYFDQVIGLKNNAITVDIGWRGSLQNAIDRILDRAFIGNKLVHIVCIAKPGVVENMYPHTNVTGFIGKCGAESNITASMLSRLYELFMLSEKGTTVGYEKDNEKINPITKHIEYPKWQIKAIKSLQQGILDFEDEYLTHIERMSISELKKKARESIVICERLMKYPTCEEVKYLKELVYDQNFGVDIFSSIIDKAIVDEFMCTPTDEYDKKQHGNSIVWRSGLYSYKDPFYYLRLISRVKSRFVVCGYIANIEEAVKKARSEGKKITLIGAGANLSQFITYISLCYSLDLIDNIVDNSKDKQGASYLGHNVEAMNKIGRDSIYLCTVKSKAAYDSLKKQIENIVGYGIELIGYGRE